MNLSETITSAIVAMASLSLPVILGFLLYSTLQIRKDLNQDMQDLRKNLHQDISAINSRLGRIEGRLFGADGSTPG